MAFPGTYNFNYYRGDTFEFIIRPKDGNGDSFPLTGYEASMKIAESRGPGITQYAAQAVVNPLTSIVTCTISPTTGRSLTTDKTWVYDVEINDGSSVYTLLNGNIIVTDDVTGAV